jgi:hypothetical protein
MMAVAAGCGNSSRHISAPTAAPTTAAATTTTADPRAVALTTIETNYRAVLVQVRNNLQALPPSATGIDFAEAVKPLSGATNTPIAQVEDDLGNGQWGSATTDEQAWLAAVGHIGDICSGFPRPDQFTAAINTSESALAKLRADVGLPAQG